MASPSGLGVLYPNLKEANPNKIVSGFGGTLCLVVSSWLYILASRAAAGVFGAAGLPRTPGLGRGGRHRRLCHPVLFCRLATFETGIAAVEKYLLKELTISDL